MTSSNGMPSQGTQWWLDGLARECVQLQIDLSCLVDGELGEAAAARAVAHIETCSECRAFFEDTRQQVRAHRDVQDPDRLLDRYSRLLGVEVTDEVEAIELVCRLANIFYQLGKAYALTEMDPRYVTRLFEQPVPVAPTRAEGRGFVDGVLESGRGDAAGLDWAQARHLFNGTLSRIEGGLAKGRRLLEEALRADPNHEESGLWLALVDVHEGRALKAARRFRELFDTAIDPANRGHAAVQLALLHTNEEDFRAALLFSRWITLSGLADRDERFFFVRFNIGYYHARMGNGERAIASFRELLDRHPDRLPDVARLFLRSAKLRACIDAQPRLGERLLAACPELFETQAGSDAKDGDRGTENPS